MDIFREKILKCMDEANLEFPGIDKDVIVDKTWLSAEEYIISNMAVDLLSEDDKSLFRDCFLSAPEIFDAAEFLYERVPDYDIQVDKYFDKWLEMFKNNL